MYIFNNQSFKTKLDVDNHISSIKNKYLFEEYEVGKEILPDHILYPFFMELVNNHYDKDNKIGVGVKYFYFEKDEYKTLQLRIKRLDDTDVSCSCKYSKITNHKRQKNINSNNIINK